MHKVKSIVTFLLALSYSISTMLSAASLNGDYNGDGIQDIFTQAVNAGETSSLNPSAGATLSNFHRSWLTSHPDIPEITDWSEQSYAAFTANLTSNPGDELLLLGKQKIILLHGDIITPIVIYPNVRNAIISWDTNGRAQFSSFNLDVNPENYKVQFVDTDGNGTKEIFLQSKNSSDNSYIVGGNGLLLQTLSSGYLGVNWATSQINFSDENGDGRLDMVITDASGNVSIIYVSNSGTYTATPTSYTPQWARLFVQDVPNATLVSTTIPSQQAVGALDGTADVSGGAAVYSIPITLPPGRAGMQPNLSLNYSSKSNSREAGFGWSLNGLSSIQRCERDFSRDNIKAKINYNNEDKLCLNGERLVLVEGIYGADSSQYRTEKESYSLIKQLGSGQSRYFEVISSSGQTATYGKSSNSKIFYQGKSHPVGWSIQKITDLQGNRIDYSYNTIPASGQFYLDSINYTGFGDEIGNRKVTVNWLPDETPGFGYLAGGRHERRMKIDSIDVFINNSQKIRSYQLDYNISVTSHLAFLKSAKTCVYTKNEVESCLKPSIFDYNEDQPLASDSEAGSKLQSLGSSFNVSLPVQSDINSDGFDDEFYASSDNFSKNISITWGNSNRTRESFSIPSRKLQGAIDAKGVGQLSILALERNATRTIRRFGVDYFKDRVDFLTYNKTTHSFDLSTTPITLFESTSVRMMDVNGDGLDDILGVVELVDQAYNTIGIFLNNQGTFSATPNFEFNFSKFEWQNLKSRDLDQDGNMDLILNYGAQLSAYYRSTGTSFELVNSVFPSCSKNSFGDFNGDGLTDLICDQKLYWNTGDLSKLFVDSGLNTGPFSNHIMDLDHDGKDELYQVDELITPFVESEPSPCLEYNMKEIFFSDSNLVTHTYYEGENIPAEDRMFCRNYHSSRLDVYSWKKTYYKSESNTFVSEASDIESSLLLKFYDYDLDGDLDIFTYQEPDSGTVHPLAGPLIIRKNAIDASFEKLQSITDGLGRKQSFEYGRLNDPELNTSTDINLNFYSVTSTPVYPEPLINNGAIMVKTFKQSDGIGGELETQYRYQDGRQNYHGRGYLGFAKITAVEVEADKSTVTSYEQSFPMTSMVKSINVYQNSTQQLLSSVINTNAWFGPSDVNFIDTLNNVRRGDGFIDNKTYRTFTEKNVVTTYPLEANSIFSSQKETIIDWNDFDTNGNLLKLTSSFDNGFSQIESVTTNVFYADDTINNWYGKLNNTSVTIKTISNESGVYDLTLDPIKEVQTTYHWTENRQPDLITVTPKQGGGKSTSTATNYNAYGLPIKVTSSSVGETPRFVTTSYSSDNYFVASVTNAKNHSVLSEVDPRTGQVIKVTDANGLISKTDYDDFGNIIKITPPTNTGQPVFSRLTICDSGCNEVTDTNVKFKQTTYQVGTPTNVVYKDMMGRTLIAKTEGFDGSDIFVSTTFDQLGRTIFTSVPSFIQSESKGTHFNDFDVLGRPRQKIVDQAHGNKMTVDYEYSYFVTNVSATASTGEFLTVSRTHSGNGQLLQTTDALSGVTQYAYDAMGNPIVLQDANDNAIKAKYNAFAQKLYVSDPNMGLKTFGYTGFGEIDTELDANGKTYDYDYDVLGRLTLRKLKAANQSSFTTEASFNFDTQCKGALYKESLSLASYSKTYGYDASCRPVSVATNIDGTVYNQSTQYDSNYGRVKAVTYPTGLTAENIYNNQGYLSKTQNAASGYIYHQVGSMDARGQLIQAKKANGVLTEWSEFAEETGQMLSIATVASNSGNQRHLINYSYDGFGNLIKQFVENKRGSSNISSNEIYVYDDLHRLISSDRNINGIAQETINYNYDAVGNFTYKGDYVSENGYFYGNKNKSLGGNAGPNAVRSILKVSGGSTTYSYDNNGNLLTGDGKTLTYNAFNKPLTINKNGVTSTFSYGADQMRYKQIKNGLSGGTETTVYIDKSFEKITQNGVVKNRIYLGDTIITETVGGANAGNNIGFVHRDRLGSVVTITDHNGNVVDNKSYDPFGKPRKGTMDRVEPFNTPTLANVASLDNFELYTNRGFTDQEHLDDAELIHMNGRVYDYNLGRFLSVDPFIQSPGNSQSMNPYSYIMNNPLAGTDPSGYLSTYNGDDFGGGAGGLYGGSGSGYNGFEEDKKDPDKKPKEEEKEEPKTIEEIVKEVCTGKTVCILAIDDTGKNIEIYGTNQNNYGQSDSPVTDFTVGAVKGALASTANAIVDGMMALNCPGCIANKTALSMAGVNTDTVQLDPADTNIGQLGQDLGPIVPIGGIAGITQKLLQKGMRVVLDPKKFNYIFGKVSSSAHNAARSNQLALTMEALGVQNNKAGQKLLTEHFNSIVSGTKNIIKNFPTKHGNFEVRESLFFGPSGKAVKFETTFEVMSDGTRKFNTVIPKGSVAEF